ncbi:MAG: hypothetical protein QNJ01_04570 [Desulfobacterales bacterium]|nr:hypothetical protein [Desulfobacterales bacterium]
MKIFIDAQATEMLALFGRDPDWQMQPGLSPVAGQVPHRLVKQTPITKNLNGRSEAIGFLEIGYTSKFIQEEINRTSVLILGLGAVFLTTIIGILIVVARGHRMVFMPVNLLTSHIIHINHATMALHAELGSSRKNISRGLQRIQKIFRMMHAERIPEDASLDA